MSQLQEVDCSLDVDLETAEDWQAEIKAQPVPLVAVAVAPVVLAQLEPDSWGQCHAASDCVQLKAGNAKHLDYRLRKALGHIINVIVDTILLAE